MLRLPLDGRADIYSLGLLLDEALGGIRPRVGPRVGRLHRRNSRVSVGLSDIIARCLRARILGDRYPDAASLAADLRHLPGRPAASRGPQPEPGRALANWRRRRPARPGTALALIVARRA